MSIASIHLSLQVSKEQVQRNSGGMRMISMDTSVCLEYVKYVTFVKNTLMHVFSVHGCLAHSNTTTGAVLFKYKLTCRLELLDESTGCYIPCV